MNRRDERLGLGLGLQHNSGTFSAAETARSRIASVDKSLQPSLHLSDTRCRQRWCLVPRCRVRDDEKEEPAARGEALAQGQGHREEGDRLPAANRHQGRQGPQAPGVQPAAASHSRAPAAARLPPRNQRAGAQAAGGDGGPAQGGDAGGTRGFRVAPGGAALAPQLPPRQLPALDAAAACRRSTTWKANTWRPRAPTATPSAASSPPRRAACTSLPPAAPTPHNRRLACLCSRRVRGLPGRRGRGQPQSSGEAGGAAIQLLVRHRAGRCQRCALTLPGAGSVLSCILWRLDRYDPIDTRQMQLQRLTAHR